MCKEGAYILQKPTSKIKQSIFSKGQKQKQKQSEA
jgi:hypothetical protein